MKRTSLNVVYSRTVVMIAALLAIIFLASPNLTLAAPKDTVTDRTDVRIVKMEKELKITAAQEALWKNLKEVMRENAEKMDALTKARIDDKAKTMNAVEDLKSYSGILDANAEGMKKYIPAFEELYNSMSDEQKRNADNMFRITRHGKPVKSKRK